MSDYEDEEMDDVDQGGNLQDAMTFSASNTNAKGKRTAANLPVEAEDSLPWYLSADLPVETYSDRPQGRKVPPKHPRRRLRTSRYSSNYWQIR